MPVLSFEKGQLDVESGVTLMDVLKDLKKDSAKAKELGVSKVINQAIMAEYNGVFSDLSTVIDKDARVSFFGTDSEEGLDILRHSASHIMAQAVMRLYPGTRLGIGPTIKNGFYYDMDIPAQISDSDLKDIESEIKKIVKEDIPFEREEMSIDEAIELFKKENQDYKVELLRDMKARSVSVYRQGEFVDLCRGPHIPSTRYLKAFKLQSVAGAYWRGDEKNDMLTRVYGTAFADKKELNAYLNMLEEARKRDHRKLGKELKLFSFHDEGPGLPFYLPRGTVLKNQLLDYMRDKIQARDYVEIETPMMLREELWETSGHKENYADNMYFVETREDEQYAVKPMNCPGGMLVYKEEKHSYRDLPLRVAEFGKVHRFERSGQLHGLIRVRGFTQDDAHVFMTEDMIEDEVLNIIELIDEVYTDFGFEYSLELSTKPEKAIGSDALWDKSTEALRNALQKFGRDFKINEGDGAFYGPKIDYHLTDAIGRTHQCGTVQLDMNLPERFDLNYTGSDGDEHRVVMLHRAIYGSIDRFMAILIEHYGGKFPMWLAPVQAIVLPVSDKFNDYGEYVVKALKMMKLRTDFDFSSEKLGYKIRKATLEKIPYMIIVGEKEKESESISVRSRDDGEIGSLSLQDFLQRILEENAKKS